MSTMPDTDIFRYRLVERRVLDLVEAGELVPGRRLPSIRQMSSRLGVGIATVNHAYQELERKGMLEARPRSGFFLRKAESEPQVPVFHASKPSAPRPGNRSALIATVLESLGDSKLMPFGVVCPQENLLPVRPLARIAGSIARERGGEVLEYAPVQGSVHLRRQISFRLQDQGLDLGADDLVITNGCMEALNIALRCLTRPGDAVCIQSPTYYCFLQLLETLGLRVIELPNHPDRGIDPDDLRATVRRYDVRAAIFSANFNNPDGALKPDDAKREIVEILAEHRIPLVEDDVSGDVYFGRHRPSCMKKYDAHGLVLHCSSFSKTMAPGLRVGWMAPGRFLEKVMEIKATTSVSSATLPQETVAAYLAMGKFDKFLDGLRNTVSQVMRTMRHHVASSFPEGTRVTRPKGGLVLWVELPGNIDGVEMFFRAREAGIGIAPGSIFTTQERFGNFIRLSCGVTWNDEVSRGLERLGELAKNADGDS